MSASTIDSTDAYADTHQVVNSATRRTASERGVALVRFFFRSRLLGWTALAAAVAAWQISSTVEYNPTVSSPARIGSELIDGLLGGEMLWSMLDTLRTMAIGFAIAVPVGIGLGFLMGRVRVVWALLEPTVEVARLHPTSALIPVLILFLGLGDSMKISVFLLSAIFPLLMTTYAGAKSVSPTLSETAKTFQLSWIRTQWEIALPSSLPYILVGMRQALGAALLMSVVVGMLAGNSGIGYFILEAQQSLNITKLLAAVVTVAAVGYLLNSIFLIIERRSTRWRRTDTTGD
jgi:ABC-type nitrate/sulfonate/bicarbonate transport system permease component